MDFYKNYILKPLKLFLNTFKNKKLGLILAIDVFFYLIFYLGFKIFANQATKILSSLQNLNLNTIQNLNNVDVEAANQLLSKLQLFMVSILSSIFLFILFIILILTLIKGYEWSKIVNKKLELYDYVKLLILNILWFIIWIIIFIIPFSFIEKQKYLTHIYYLFPPILYFTLFLYMGYAQTKRIGKALIAPVKGGLLKIYKYVSAIIIIVLFFEIPLFFKIPFVISKLINLQNKTLHLTIFLLLLLITLAVYKLYFYSIGKEVEHEN